MMFKYLRRVLLSSLLALSIFAQPVGALIPSGADREALFQEKMLTFFDDDIKFADFYKQYEVLRHIFERELKFNLFASDADNASVAEKRKALRSKFSPEEIKTFNESLEPGWQSFIANVYKSPEEFQKQLESHNLSKDYVKAKFFDNYIMVKYFDKFLAVNVLESQLNDEIVLREAKQRGLSISQAELDLGLLQSNEDFGSQAALNSFLKINRLSKEDFLEDLSKSLLINKFKVLLASENEAEILSQSKLYYQNRKELNYTEASKIFYSQFYLKKSPENLEKAKEIISEVRTKFLRGNKPLLLTSEFSEEGLKYEKMYLPHTKGSKLYKEKIVEALDTLKPGETSAVIETEDAFHLLTVEEIIPALTKPFALLEADIREKVIESRKQQAYLRWLKEARLAAKINYNKALISKLFAPEQVVKPVLKEAKPKLKVAPVLAAPVVAQKTVESKPEVKAAPVIAKPVVVQKPVEAKPEIKADPSKELKRAIGYLKAMIPEDMASLREAPKKFVINANRLQTKSQEESIQDLQTELLRLRGVIRSIQL